MDEKDSVCDSILRPFQLKVKADSESGHLLTSHIKPASTALAWQIKVCLLEPMRRLLDPINPPTGRVWGMAGDHLHIVEACSTPCSTAAACPPHHPVPFASSLYMCICMESF